MEVQKHTFVSILNVLSWQVQISLSHMLNMRTFLFWWSPPSRPSFLHSTWSSKPPPPSSNVQLLRSSKNISQLWAAGASSTFKNRMEDKKKTFSGQAISLHVVSHVWSPWLVSLTVHLSSLAWARCLGVIVLIWLFKSNDDSFILRQSNLVLQEE